MAELNLNNKKIEIANLNKRRDDIQYSLNQIEIPKYTEEQINEKIAELSAINLKIEAIAVGEKEEMQRKNKKMAIMAEKPVEIDYDREIESLQKQMDSIISGTDTFCAEILRPCPSLQKQVDNQTEYYRDQIEKRQLAKQTLQSALAEYVKKLEAIGPEIQYDVESLKSLKDKQISLNAFLLEKDRTEFLKGMKVKQEKDFTDVSDLLMVAEMDLVGLQQNLMAVGNELVKVSMLATDSRDYAMEKRRKQIEINENSVRLSLAETATAKVNELDIIIAEKTEKQHTETEKFEELTLVKEAFGSTGIKSVVIDYILPGLEDKINETLSKLSSFTITLDTQRKGLNGDKEIEGLFIDIFNPEGEKFDYDSYSGGQKNRIAYAIFEGLASIQKCNFRIFDESIAGLDNETISAFADVMLQLNQEDRQVLCVSHIREIQDIFSNKLEVINVNGDSKII